MPYTDEQIEAPSQDAHGQGNPDSEAAEGLLERYGERVQVRDFALDGPRLSEMDALIAYLQMLGTLVDFDSFQNRAVREGGSHARNFP